MNVTALMNMLPVPALGAGAGTDKLKEVNPLFELLMSIEWNWLLYFATAAFLVFAVILFGAMFYRQWREPRLGYFIFCAAVFAVRVMRPDDKFWNVAAFVGGVACLFTLASVIAGKRISSGRELIFYPLVTFSLFLLTFEVNFVLGTLGAITLAASLFFLATTPPSGRHQLKNRQADHNILDSLEQKSKRQL